MAPTDPQMKKICILINEKAVPEMLWRQWIWDMFQCNSRKELMVEEANQFIEYLLTWQTPGQQLLQV